MGFIVLGLDPGLQATGWGVVKVNGGDITLGEGAGHWGQGTIRTSKDHKLKVGEDTRLRIDRIMQDIQDIVELYIPDYVALEEFTFYSGGKRGKPLGQSMAGLQCSRLCGAVQEFCRSRKLHISEMQSRDIKTAVVGYWKNVEKIHVKNAVRMHLRMSKNPKSEHSADALAAAITMAGDMNLARRTGT